MDSEETPPPDFKRENERARKYETNLVRADETVKRAPYLPFLLNLLTSFPLCSLLDDDNSSG
jgi:hypothetical protein